MSVRIRPGRSSDLAAIARIYVLTFSKDNIHSRMHPKSDMYPADHENWAYRYFYARYWGHQEQMFHVAVVDGVDGGPERVAGFVWWRRNYLDEKKKAKHEGWFTIRGWIQPILLTLNDLAKRLWPPRSADPAWINVFDSAGGIVQPLLEDPPQRKLGWYLSTLSVDPAFQGKGYGSMLVAHTLQRVDAEGVTAWLIGVKGVEPFYERLGFVEKGRANIGPLADWEGGAVMFRE